MPKRDRTWLALFVDFNGKPCLVVGGGSVAAGKTRRLLAAGARVTLVAPRLGKAAAALVDDDRIVVHRRPYCPDDLQGQRLVVAATDDHALNTAIAEAARALDIPVNVAAPGRLSTALLPKVIDRTPVRIAVSGGGASPALTRQLNRHLDALIPRAYGELAALLAEFRAAIGTRFTDPGERRRFYDSIVNGPVSEHAFAGHHAKARQMLCDAVRVGRLPAAGEVYLVGAGPGEAELLTLRALRLMQQADVVVYDRLIGPKILDLVRSDAKRCYVGKAPGNHAHSQRQINQLLVEHAQAGKRVLRLKGGDPFMFGRGGEEIEALIAARIPFQVVPGITAAAGCAAYAGIPLTHRELAHACVFLTGHCRDGETDIDWRAVTQPGHTLVFYMGVHNLQKICRRLLEHGLPATTPAAIIQNGTLPDQRILIASLGELPRCEIDSTIPGLVIVGETVRLSPHFSKESADSFGSCCPGRGAPARI